MAGSVSPGFDDRTKGYFAIGLLCAAGRKFYGWTAFGRSVSTGPATSERMTRISLASGCVLLVMAAAMVWHGTSWT